MLFIKSLLLILRVVGATSGYMVSWSMQKVQMRITIIEINLFNMGSSFFDSGGMFSLLMCVNFDAFCLGGISSILDASNFVFYRPTPPAHHLCPIEGSNLLPGAEFK